VVYVACSALTLLVLWQKGDPTCKKTEWWGAGVVVCLEQGAGLHMVQLMPLPLTVSCFSKIQIGFTFLVPVHPGCPGKRAVKRVCVLWCMFCLSPFEVFHCFFEPCLFPFSALTLQCFDAVGWAAGRASGL